jgi:hypothetical protein
VSALILCGNFFNIKEMRDLHIGVISLNFYLCGHIVYPAFVDFDAGCLSLLLSKVCDVCFKVNCPQFIVKVVVAVGVMHKKTRVKLFWMGLIPH